MKKLFFIGFIFLISCNIEEDPEADYSLLLAYSYSEDYVKEKLKDPSSAEFVESRTKLQHTVHLGNWEYEIKSFVIATNSFGGRVKTNFTCRIKFDKENETVKLMNLRIE